MDHRVYSEPPIRPFAEPRQSRQLERQIPLVLPENEREKLRRYLPPARDKFLREDDPKDIQVVAGIPHVTLTYAQSLDSQISLHPGQRTTLSGPETKAMTHWLRTNHDAILIGAGTANADDPGLNSRYSADGKDIVGLEHQPRPCILDPGRSWKQHKCEKLFELAKQGLGIAPWWITSEGLLDAEADQVKLRKIEEAGGHHIIAGKYGRTNDGVEWEVILRALWSTGVRSVMIEGGATVINDLLREKNQHLISSIIVTIAPTYLGRGGVVVAPPRSAQGQNEAFLHNTTWIPMGQDIVMAAFLQEK